ncbi:MAG TPA: NCS2 family permease [Opitutaceae bacterium]
MKDPFSLQSNGTTAGREFAAGLTTFAAMAYILAVNPDILANTGMDRGALVTVTALSAAVATTLMALMTNYPLALAPGMGINAFFAFTVCLSYKVPWQEALGMVFINGCIFLLLSVTGVRERIVAAIPPSIKVAITCGIGLFIAFIGLKNGGVIVSDAATFVAHGDFASPPVALCLAGILLTAILVTRKIPGAIVLSIAIVTIAGLFVSNGSGGHVTSAPTSWLSLPRSPMPLVLHLQWSFLGSWAKFHQALPIILTLLLIDMFDNIGTLIGVTKRAGYLREDGTLPRAGRALVADSIATILSSLLGTSTVVSYIESAAGVEAGGRTGLTSLTTAVLMLLALFFTPLILAVPSVATAPTLVIVGVFMMQSVREIRMEEFDVAVPAVLTLLAIPLCFSIASGIGIGLIGAALLALGTGKGRSFPAAGYVIAAVFFLDFFRIFPFN